MLIFFLPFKSILQLIFHLIREIWDVFLIKVVKRLNGLVQITQGIKGLLILHFLLLITSELKLLQHLFHLCDQLLVHGLLLCLRFF